MAINAISQQISNLGQNTGPSLEESQLFGNALTELLKSYQQIEKYPFVGQQISGQEEQAKRLSFTDPGLIGANPGLQSQARGASAAALEPTIQGASAAQQTFASRLGTFADVLNQGRQIQAQAEASALQQKADAQNLINNAIANFGPDAFNGVDPKQIAGLEKLAGVGAGYVTSVSKALRAREAALRSSQVSWQDTGQVDENGNPVYVNPKTLETKVLKINQGTAPQVGPTEEEIAARMSFEPKLRSRGTIQSIQSFNRLPKNLVTPVQSLAGQFDSEQAVKNFQTIGEGYQFVSGLSNKTTNPADDQALIYALAKALDPNSVVREGEYATAQKYSQSWVKAFGKSVNQAVRGTGFLSEEARKNIKDTILSRYQASLQSFNNIYQDYGRRINNLTGRSNGTDYITDYSRPFTQAINQSRVGSNSIFDPAAARKKYGY